MKYIFLPEASRQTSVPVRLLWYLCEEQKVDGAIRFGSIWAVPDTISVSVLDMVKEPCGRH